MKESLDELGKIINDSEADEENEIKTNTKDNDIKSQTSKKSKVPNKSGRQNLKKTNNLQEIDDFLIVLDNSEEYKKMILDQAKNKIRRAIKKIKEAKDKNEIIYDPTASKKYIINPERNLFLLFYSYLIFILLYIDIIISPFEYFVYYDEKAKIIRIVLFDLVFIGEIILTIFTSYYDTLNKYYVTDIKKIFKNYLWNGFIPNVIYVFPFYLFHHNLEIIRLFKIYRYPSISGKSKIILTWILSFIFKNNTIISQIVRVTILFLSLVYILHICACFYCYLGLKYSNSWIWQYTELLDNSSILDIYVSSYYFIAETFSSTGYGDLTPINSIEILFIMFCEILNCGLYAYLLSNILDILTGKENSYTNKFRADQTQFEQWMTYYISKLPSSSKMINLHRHTIWRQSNLFHELYYNNTKNFLWLKDNDFFMQMKPTHRKELLNKAFDSVFTKFHKFFNEITKLSSKINIIINLKTTIQVNNTEIIKKGKEHKKIYFIDKGEIDIFYEDKKINTLKEGNIFGLEGLLSNNNKSECEYKVNDNCRYAILFYIEIESLIKDILNYDGNSFKNLYRKAKSEHIKLKSSNELNIINEEDKEGEGEGEEKGEGEGEEGKNNIINTSSNNDINNEEIINNNDKKESTFNFGLLNKLNENLANLERAKKLIDESELRITLIDKQIKFINNYFSKFKNNVGGKK